MKGRLTLIPVGGAITLQEVVAPPRLEFLQVWIGGYLEAVPGFTRYEGQPCVAFCNEDGKRKRMDADGREDHDRLPRRPGGNRDWRRRTHVGSVK
jgi:hypothetical protein